MMSKYQVMEPLTPDELAALRADIELHGVLQPPVVDENDETIDGHNRRAIARELGIECPVIVKAGLADDEKYELAYRLNAARRHLTTKQKQQLAADAITRWDGVKSDREIAGILGISNSTVSLARKRMSGPDDTPGTRPARKRRKQTAGTPGKAGTSQNAPGTPVSVHAPRLPGFYQVCDDEQEFRIQGVLALAVGDEMHPLEFDAEDEAVIRAGGTRYTITRQPVRQRTVEARAE